MCKSIYTPSQIQDWYGEDQIWARNDRQYSLRLWILWTRNTKIRMRLTWTHRVSHGTISKSGRNVKNTVYGVDLQLAQQKGLTFYQTSCNAIIFSDSLPAYCISKVVVMESGEIIYEKVYVFHITSTTTDDFLQRSLDERIGFRSRWKQQRHPTNPTKNPIIKNGETGGWMKLHPKLRVDACQNWRRRSNKNGETRKGGGARHWLQGTRIVTCSCERSRTFPSSRACQKDRKSSSSRSTSSRLAAEERLQPIQQQFEGDDSRIGQCSVIRVVRNFSKSTMFSLSSLLESRNWLLHLRTLLGWKRIQKKV